LRVLYASKEFVLYVALAAVVAAAICLTVRAPAAVRATPPAGFVATNGTRFIAEGRAFRFVGANVAVMYKDEDRAAMPETLRQAALHGVKVVRVWASGEGTEETGVLAVGGDRADWPRRHPFRRAPDDWNEEAFVHLDHVLAEARKQNLRVQLTLVNWWRDTGGVTQYLRWAGVNDAADVRYKFGVNPERAMLFYTNEEARRLYRAHVARVVGRRNTVTGVLYKDDPTIFGYELMNEAQALTGREGERRAWVAEMSAYVKSLDPFHLVTPGAWGYRNAYERRDWLALHSLPAVDYCDVHNYPRDDLDTFVDSPDALREFIENRVAAAASINKPLVVGEFGMSPDGYKGVAQAAWFRGYFEAAARAGAGGALFWILTPDPQRGYGVTYAAARDETVLAELPRAATLFDSLRAVPPPRTLLMAGQHLVPRQFAFARAPADTSAQPRLSATPENALLYRFAPEQATAGRFEKLDGGDGYVWGAGVGSFEYTVPARADRRRVGELVVRAHLQPVLPHDGDDRVQETRVTLFVNGTDCGARLVNVEHEPNIAIAEWRVRAWRPRYHAWRGHALTVRFEVEVDADRPFGINISNFPEWFKAGDTKPVEVEVRREVK
jgi:mannan endo-1,4-beta-mannosidase